MTPDDDAVTGDDAEHPSPTCPHVAAHEQVVFPAKSSLPLRDAIQLLTDQGRQGVGNISRHYVTDLDGDGRRHTPSRRGLHPTLFTPSTTFEQATTTGCTAPLP